jgi:hypothetical protein
LVLMVKAFEILIYRWPFIIDVIMYFKIQNRSMMQVLFCLSSGIISLLVILDEGNTLYYEEQINE